MNARKPHRKRSSEQKVMLFLVFSGQNGYQACPNGYQAGQTRPRPGCQDRLHDKNIKTKIY